MTSLSSPLLVPIFKFHFQPKEKKTSRLVSGLYLKWVGLALSVVIVSPFKVTTVSVTKWVFSACH